ncbi:MAG: orotate phosphoribosyltransferase, partial [Bacteroidetes bacterium]|nr:orotate phosphoribosyltransferase [Bacteroidota bacterium]
HFQNFDAEVVGVGSIVDRSNGKVKFGYPQISAIKMDVVSFLNEDCELCKKNIPLVKPGSRKIK